jgi:membrane fusion protein (multidrug efflux system)
MIRGKGRGPLWIRLAGGLGLAAAVALSGCAADDTNAKTWREGERLEGERKEEAVPVEVAALERGGIEAVLRFSANLEAERQVQVFAEAPRRVTQLLVEEGSRVDKGQLLVRLQNEEQRSSVAKVESQLKQSRRELEQQKDLFEQDLITEQVYNDAAYAVERRELELTDARRELGYTEVRAPIAGVVTERLVNLGDHVKVNQALFRIVDFDSIVARIYVPEKELRRLRKGQEARLRADALGGHSFPGSIDRISPVVDPGTGTVKVTVATPDEGGLRPGMYVAVELVTAVHEDALLVPKRALAYDNDQVFVFRLGEERRVERLKLAALLENADFIEPTGGLEAGDQIVVAGQSGLKDGGLVRLPGDPDPEQEEGAEDEES